MKGTYYKTPIVANASNLFLIGKLPNLRIAKLFTTFVRYYERNSKNIYGRRGKAAFWSATAHTKSARIGKCATSSARCV